MTEQPANLVTCQAGKIPHTPDGDCRDPQPARPFADRVPAPRPVPNMAARFRDARCHTPEQHRHTDGQEADDRSKDRAIRELEAERDRARVERDDYARSRNHFADLIQATTTALDMLPGDGVDKAPAAASRLRAKLEAAQELISELRNNRERDDRAFAKYDTAPEVTPVETEQPQGPTPGEARRQLDQAIATALPLAGRKAAELLQALQGELARVDSGRAAINDEAEEPPGSVSPPAQDDVPESLRRALVTWRVSWRGMPVQPADIALAAACDELWPLPAVQTLTGQES
ncbi:hypothetical protein ACPB67_02545 [Micromonospora taraxaci]|uniref:hypothetical protein n=1 Tax=Micromonospora taraxaci TaxID=1316803 RepID=UPI003C2CCC34